MKRLWVRLSLAFATVVVVSMIALAATPFVLDRAGLLDRGGFPGRRGPPPFEELPPEFEGQFAVFRERIFQRLSQNLLVIAVAGSLAGIGAGIWISRSLAAPLDELADAARAIGARDLSRRVTIEGSQEMVDVAVAFNQMAADLERAELLRSNLIADVSHELRTPLTVLQGNLRAMLDDVYAMDKEEVSRLYDQTRHLSRLVEDLNELAQAEARQLPLHLQETDVMPHIQSVAAVFEPVAQEKSVRLVTDLPDILPPVQVDADRFTQVLHNIFANALRHTPDGGTITLRASALQEAISIAVEDTGEGIAPEHLGHVFDRFYRTDQSRARDTGGTGLGLAIVKAIVEAHNGRVTVASEGIGKGTTFRVFLPLQTK
jgi:signal transduction histidine kinase